MQRATLGRVHALLVRLLEVVRGLPEGTRLAFVWRGGDQLEVYEKEPLEASAGAGGGVASDSRELASPQLNCSVAPPSQLQRRRRK